MNKTIFFLWILSSFLVVQAQEVVTPQIQVLNVIDYKAAKRSYFISCLTKKSMIIVIAIYDSGDYFRVHIIASN